MFFYLCSLGHDPRQPVDADVVEEADRVHRQLFTMLEVPSSINFVKHENRIRFVYFIVHIFLLTFKEKKTLFL